jgi:amidase
MKRRTFIQLSAAGGAVLPAITISGCTSREDSDEELSSTAPPPPFELDEMTVDQLTEAMAAGRLTAQSIAEKYLARIEAIDRTGIALNSVIELNPDALDIAAALDRERQEGRVRGPLHGIPVLIKDNIDTADKMRTTAGSLSIEDNIAAQDSWVAAQLRQAGAVILGKTNLSEWANFRSTRSSSGWSSRGGQTHNPYALNRNPCGSSSGSGVAVAANLCALAIGTETNGSVLSPSSINGIVGIKPTVGLVGRSGIIPISHTQDTAGPMARTVRDAALLLGALTGVDPRDEATLQSRDRSHTDYIPFLVPDGLRGARIGVDRHAFGYHEGVDRLIEEALQLMRDQGATLIDLERVCAADTGDDEFNILLYEFKDGLNKYLAGMPANVSVRSLKDVIAFNEANADRAMPWFAHEILVMAEAKGDLSTPEYRTALENVRRTTRDEGIDKALKDHQLDAIVAPTESPAWTTDLINGDRYISGGKGYNLAAMAAYPSVTVPAGAVHGLPVGITFFASAFAEPTLLRLAYAYEQASKHRRTPGFLKDCAKGVPSAKD